MSSLPSAGKRSGTNAKRRTGFGSGFMCLETRDVPSATFDTEIPLPVTGLADHKTPKHVQGPVLTSGVVYEVTVKGSDQIAKDAVALIGGDAEYQRWSSAQNDGKDVSLSNTNTGVRFNNAIRLDGVPGNTAGNLWGAETPDHTYKIKVIGQGAALDMFYRDSPGTYGDNSDAPAALDAAFGSLRFIVTRTADKPGVLTVSSPYVYPTNANPKSWGNFMVLNQFKVTGDGNLQGLILQHVTSTAKINGNVSTVAPVQYKGPDGLTTSNFDLNGGDYWEAWYVGKTGLVSPTVDTAFAFKLLRPLAAKGIFPELRKVNQFTFNKETHDFFGFLKAETIGTAGGDISITGDAYYIRGANYDSVKALGFTKPDDTGRPNGTGAGGKLYSVNSSDLSAGNLAKLTTLIGESAKITHSVTSAWDNTGKTTLVVK